MFILFFFSQVMIDALVLSGTNPAFLILRDLITKGKITGEQAANVVAFLPGTIETPTKELLSAFFVSFHFFKNTFIMFCNEDSVN